MYTLCNSFLGAQAPFKEIFSTLVFTEISVEAIAHDPVNRKLAITSHDGDIQLWDMTKDGVSHD
jgi:hypothetical protein